jgi:hypothetical protein
MRSHGVLSFPSSASFGSSGGIQDAKGQMAQISKREASSPTFTAAQRACAEYYGPPHDIAPPGERPRDAETPRGIPLHARPRCPYLSRPEPHHRGAQCPRRDRQELPTSRRSS